MAEVVGEGTQRTAIVVVAGVGDKPSGSASEQVARSLLCFNPNEFAFSLREDEEYSPRRTWFGVDPAADPDPSQLVTRHTLYDRAHQPRVDVYEAWWADLSRFPGATRSALLAATGMFFQLTAVGRAALLGGPRLAGIARSAGYGGGGTGFPISAALLGVVEWLVAVPIVLITAVHVALLTLVWYAFRVHADTPATLLGFCALAAALTATLVWGMVRWYPRKRSNVPVVGLPLLACAIAVAIWRGVSDGRHPARGVADSIFVLTAYPFRVAWMLVALLALVIVVTTTTRHLVCRAPSPVSPWRRIGTAALSASGPFGLAILGALVYGAAGNLLQKLAEVSSFSRGANPWCLQSVNDWRPGPCAAPGTSAPAALNAFDWGKHLFQLGLTPLLYVTACVVVALVVALLVALARRRIAPAYVARVLLVAPWTLGIAVVPALALVVLTWLPLGDHVLVWHGWLEPWQTVGNDTAVGAVVAGYVVTAMLFAARSLKLGMGTLLNRGVIPEGLRIPLDLGYDISSFLREPSRPGSVAPRERMLARIAGLLDHISDARPYDRTILLTHSQGTVLATALLHDPARELAVPGGHLALVTMGSPLRSLYAMRFPVQFDWVEQLRHHPDRFVDRVDRRWVNFFADGDLVGQRLFSAPDENPPPPLPQPYPHGDVHAGSGDHGSYYFSSIVFRALAQMV